MFCNNAFDCRLEFILLKSLNDLKRELVFTLYLLDKEYKVDNY